MKPKKLSPSRCCSPTSPPSSSSSSFESKKKKHSSKKDLSMSIRCSFCKRSQLFAGKNQNSPNYELLQITPVISIHKLCLKAAHGLQLLNRKNDFEFSNEEIAGEVERCKKIQCNFCAKPGASVKCSIDACWNSYHLTCFYTKLSNRKGRKSWTKTFCSRHGSASDCSTTTETVQTGDDNSKKCRKRKRNLTEKNNFEVNQKRRKIEEISSDKIGDGFSNSPNNSSELKKKKKVKKSSSSSNKIDKSNSPISSSTDIKKRKKVEKSSKAGQICCITPCRFDDNHNLLNLPLKKCLKCQQSSAHSLCVIGHKSWECPECVQKIKPKMSELVSTSPSKMMATSLCLSMKQSFCQDVDVQLGKSRGRKKLDRSLQSKIENYQEERIKKTKTAGGKENRTNLKKKKIINEKLAKKPKEQWIIEPSPTKNNNMALKLSKAKKLNNKKRKKEKNKKVENVKKQQEEEENSPAKKFVENCPGMENRSNNVSRSLKFEYVDSEDDEVLLKSSLVKKVAIEPISLEQRQLHHVLNSLPILHGESEAEENYQWLVDGANRQIDDFLDLNEGEKSFFKLWNTHMHKYPCFGDGMMKKVLQLFIDEKGHEILKLNLYNNFVLHLSNLYDFGIVNQESIVEVIKCLKFKVTRMSPPDNIECDVSNSEANNNTAEEDFTNTYFPLISSTQTCAYKSEELNDTVTCKSNNDFVKKEDDDESIKLYLSDDEFEDSNKDRPADLILYTSDCSVENIVDIPALRSGLRTKGTRFGSFSTTVVYQSRKNRIRRKNDSPYIFNGRPRKRRRRNLMNQFNKNEFNFENPFDGNSAITIRRRQCSI